MKKTTLLCFLICITLLCGCKKSPNSSLNSSVRNEKAFEGVENMEEFASKINITINGKTFSATLEENETSREFIKRLPLNITMNELNKNEKYYYFDESLPSNSKKIDRINAGDIMLYGNDCLVLFYDTFNTNYSYTKIGKIDNPSNIKTIVGKQDINIYISK